MLGSYAGSVTPTIYIPENQMISLKPAGLPIAEPKVSLS